MRFLSIRNFSIVAFLIWIGWEVWKFFVSVRSRDNIMEHAQITGNLFLFLFFGWIKINNSNLKQKYGRKFWWYKFRRILSFSWPSNYTINYIIKFNYTFCIERISSLCWRQIIQISSFSWRSNYTNLVILLAVRLYEFRHLAGRQIIWISSFNWPSN